MLDAKHHRGAIDHGDVTGGDGVTLASQCNDP